MSWSSPCKHHLGGIRTIQAITTPVAVYREAAIDGFPVGRARKEEVTCPGMGCCVQNRTANDYYFAFVAKALRSDFSHTTSPCRYCHIPFNLHHMLIWR